MKNPELALADELSAHLDSINTHDVITLLQKINKEVGATGLLCTHDDRIFKIAPHNYKFGRWSHSI